MYYSPRPYYADPDAKEAVALGVASYMLATAGRRAEAEQYAEEARAFFDNVPYDKKKQAKILGDAKLLPNGVLCINLPGNQYEYHIPTRPYEIAGENDQAKSMTDAAKKKLKDIAMKTAKNTNFGWPAYAQLSSELSGTKMRPSNKTLAKAVQSICSAVNTMQAANWSETAMKVFRDAANKSGLLQNGVLGSSEIRFTVCDNAHRITVRPDEGTLDQFDNNYGRVIWFSPDVMQNLAASLAKLEKINWRDVYETMKPVEPCCHAVWFPRVNSDTSQIRSIARGIAKKAVDQIATDMQLTEHVNDRLGIAFRDAVENGLTCALRAKAMFDALDIFLEAARRDENTDKLFKTLSLLPKNKIPERGNTVWFGGIAAATISTQHYYYRWYWEDDKKHCDVPEETQSEFAYRVERLSRQYIMEWAKTDEAEKLFAPAPGAYYNCPVATDGQDTENPEDENTARKEAELE